MPYKDPANQRAYQADWVRHKRAKMSNSGPKATESVSNHVEPISGGVLRHEPRIIKTVADTEAAAVARASADPEKFSLLRHEPQAFADAIREGIEAAQPLVTPSIPEHRRRRKAPRMGYEARPEGPAPELDADGNAIPVEV